MYCFCNENGLYMKNAKIQTCYTFKNKTAYAECVFAACV